MSLKSAKAIDDGIFLEDSRKKALIVPCKIILDESSNKVIKFESSINRSLYMLLAQNLSRYTIIFDSKNLSNPPELRFMPYFSESSLEIVRKNARRTMKGLSRLLADLGIKLMSLNPENILQEIYRKIPKNIAEISPRLFKIIAKECMFYLSNVGLSFATKQQEKEFPLFIKDFFGLIANGRINIDVKNTQSGLKLPSSPKSSAAITITLEGTELAPLKTDQKRLLSLIRVFIENKTNGSENLAVFCAKEVLQENFGKIILGQGWNFSQTDHEGLLDFAAFFRLLMNQ